MAERRRYEDSDISDDPSSSSTKATTAFIQETGGDVHFTMRDHAKLEFVVEQRTSYRKAVTLRKLIQTINDNTKAVTAIDVLQDFQNEELQQPDFEVYPQMRQVDVSDYYKGRYENSRLPFTDQSEWHHKQFSQFGHNQLTKEIGFIRQGEVGGKTIDVDEVMASVWRREILDSSKSVGTTAIVASAGSGKSTLTRRIARQALSMSTAREEVEDMHSSGLKMVHFVELNDIEETGKIKPSKFLFGGLYPNEEDEEEAFKWLDEHQSDVILIFDGLDQARWHFDEKSFRKIKMYEAASSWTIMHNILARNILHHVKVYIASREFAVSELPAMARPKTIITLNGLTLEDAYRLFVFLLEEKGEELWQKIKSMSPRLLNLVSVPVFLILTAVVMGRDPSKPPPKTVTELYNRIILALQSVENIRNRDQILSIVNKLKTLAFQGMKEGRVVFKETDLTQLGVSAVEVQDLMTKVPGNNLLSRHLVQGDFTFFFCHQSVQEYLAAIFITEMEFKEFSRFNEEHLHGKRWSVVRRFVAGVVFSKSQNDLYKVSDRTDKQQILEFSIRFQLAKSRDDKLFTRNKIMELYTVMYESGDDALMKQLSAINASEISLSRDEAHIVGTLAARNQNLRSLNLFNCSIDDELLGIITRCLENRIHVKEVDLRANKFSASALCSLLGHRRIESLSGKLDWEVVKMTIGEAWVELKNEEDVIKISGSHIMTVTIEGYFNVKDSTLSFKKIHPPTAMKFFINLFDAELIEELCVTQAGLRELLEWKVKKISKIVLDCTEEESIDWSLIETCWKQYQLDLLEIAVNDQIPVDDYKLILEWGRAISVPLHIHAMFYVEKADDFRKTLEACQQKKIEYIRCILCYPTSLDDISSLINNSNLKKATLVYYSESDMLKGDELQKVEKIANDLDTELEILKLPSFSFNVEDAWQRLDYDFYWKEFRRRNPWLNLRAVQK